MAQRLVLGVPAEIEFTDDTVVQITGGRVARFLGIYTTDVDLTLVFTPVEDGGAVPASGTVPVAAAVAQLFWHELDGRGRFLGIAGSGAGTALVVLR